MVQRFPHMPQLLKALAYARACASAVAEAQAADCALALSQQKALPVEVQMPASPVSGGEGVNPPEDLHTLHPTTHMGQHSISYRSPKIVMRTLQVG